MKYALIISGKVREIITTDNPAEKYSPWIVERLVESDTAHVGQVYSGGVFSDPAPRVPDWFEGRRLTPPQQAHLLDCVADMVDSMETAGASITPKMNTVRNKVRQLQAQHPEV